MNSPLCENFEICRLVCAKDFQIQPNDKAGYIRSHCTSGKENWCKCNRYVTKSTLGFCPDFVLPDSEYSTDEVIAKFDNGSN